VIPTATPRVVAIPRVLDVGPGALEGLGETLRRANFPLDRVLLVQGQGASAALAEVARRSLIRAGAHLEVCYGTLGTHAEADALGLETTAANASLVVGAGGGRVIDVAKVVALRSGRDVVSVPTSIASDGICSPIASLKDASGRRESVPARMPAGIVLDTDVVASAPFETRTAGLGDLLSNLVASLDWRLAGDRRAEDFDPYSAMIAESAARPALAVEDLCRASALEIVAKGLILSGLAMATAGTSRPCSGSEHLISHSLDHLLGSGARLHGRQVALGALVAATAHESELAALLRAVFRRCGLPTCPADLGLPVGLVVDAVQRAPDMRPGRYTVLSEIDLGTAAVRDLVERAFSPGDDSFA
jgi:glycerol-1-phosphate dehydrogenase [NAD(P)+]